MNHLWYTRSDVTAEHSIKHCYQVNLVGRTYRRILGRVLRRDTGVGVPVGTPSNLTTLLTIFDKLENDINSKIPNETAVDYFYEPR